MKEFTITKIATQRFLPYQTLSWDN